MRSTPSDTQNISANREGAVRLNTGDNFIRVPGMESVMTQAGDGVVINTRNGVSSLSVLGNARVEHIDQDGTARVMKKGELPAGFT